MNDLNNSLNGASSMLHVFHNFIFFMFGEFFSYKLYITESAKMINLLTSMDVFM